MGRAKKLKSRLSINLNALLTFQLKAPELWNLPFKKIRKLEMMKLELKKEEQQQEEEGQKSNSELEELREELSLKVGFLEQIRQESRQLHADLELSHRQRQELEAKIRLLEEGRQYQHHLQHHFEEKQDR